MLLLDSPPKPLRSACRSVAPRPPYLFPMPSGDTSSEARVPSGLSMLSELVTRLDISELLPTLLRLVVVPKSSVVP